MEANQSQLLSVLPNLIPYFFGRIPPKKFLTLAYLIHLLEKNGHIFSSEVATDLKKRYWQYWLVRKFVGDPKFLNSHAALNFADYFDFSYYLKSHASFRFQPDIWQHNKALYEAIHGKFRKMNPIARLFFPIATRNASETFVRRLTRTHLTTEGLMGLCFKTHKDISFITLCAKRQAQDTLDQLYKTYLTHRKEISEFQSAFLENQISLDFSVAVRCNQWTLIKTELEKLTDPPLFEYTLDYVYSELADLGHTSSVKSLLAQYPSLDKGLALSAAAKTGDVALLKFLHRKEKEGSTLSLEMKHQAFLTAAAQGHAPAMLYLLQTQPIDINYQKRSTPSALVQAVSKGRRHAAQILLFWRAKMPNLSEEAALPLAYLLLRKNMLAPDYAVLLRLIKQAATSPITIERLDLWEKFQKLPEHLQYELKFAGLSLKHETAVEKINYLLRHIPKNSRDQKFLEHLIKEQKTENGVPYTRFAELFKMQKNTLSLQFSQACEFVLNFLLSRNVVDPLPPTLTAPKDTNSAPHPSFFKRVHKTLGKLTSVLIKNRERDSIEQITHSPKPR